MKYTFSTLLIVLILAVSCDSESITNSFISENPPEAKIVILNEDELAEKSIGDPINLENEPRCAQTGLTHIMMVGANVYMCLQRNDFFKQR